MEKVLPNFEWQVEAVEHVARLLKTVSSALSDAGVPYAVIGGNAVAIWVAKNDVGAVRATKDVDILMRRSDLDRAAMAMDPVGLIPAEVMGIPLFLQKDNPLPSQGVHIILANEPVKENSLYPSPDVVESGVSKEGFRVIDLLPLVKMKLDAFRRMDQVHIEDMFKVGLIDADLAKQLPNDLLARLREVRDTMEWHTEPPVF
jgi:hypothetical protein